MKVTIKDVAKEANVATSTVSRALQARQISFLLMLLLKPQEQVRQVRALQLLPSRLELLQTRVHSQQLIQEVLLKVL